MDRINSAATSSGEANLTLVQVDSPAQAGGEVQPLEDWALVMVGGGENAPTW